MLKPQVKIQAAAVLWGSTNHVPKLNTISHSTPRTAITCKGVNSCKLKYEGIDEQPLQDIVPKAR
jgi:hypothetical protein